MSKTNKKTLGREKRHRRIRKKIHGTAERPRVSVYRSLKHIYVQLIDDETNSTLLSVSTLKKGSKEDKSLNRIDLAKELGVKLSAAAKEKKITRVVFDRSGYNYHGKIKVLADAAREGGLKF